MTVMVIALCLLGHPDRCRIYHLITDAPLVACQTAARQWLEDRPYFVGVALSCKEEAEA